MYKVTASDPLTGNRFCPYVAVGDFSEAVFEATRMGLMDGPHKRQSEIGGSMPDWPLTGTSGVRKMRPRGIRLDALKMMAR